MSIKLRQTIIKAFGGLVNQSLIKIRLNNTLVELCKNKIPRDLTEFKELIKERTEIYSNLEKSISENYEVVVQTKGQFQIKCRDHLNKLYESV